MDITLREKVAAVLYRRATSDDVTISIAPTQFTFDELVEVGLYPKGGPETSRNEQQEQKAWKELRRLIEEVAPWASK